MLLGNWVDFERTILVTLRVSFHEPRLKGLQLLANKGLLLGVECPMAGLDRDVGDAAQGHPHAGGEGRVGRGQLQLGLEGGA